MEKELSKFRSLKVEKKKAMHEVLSKKKKKHELHLLLFLVQRVLLLASQEAIFNKPKLKRYMPTRKRESAVIAITL